MREGGGRVGTGVLPALPSEGRTLATYLASALHHFCGKTYSRSATAPQRWQKNERAHWEYRRFEVN